MASLDCLHDFQKDRRLKYRILVDDDLVVGFSLRRVDRHIYRIFNQDNNGEVDLDARISVVDSGCNTLPRIAGSYFITWCESYTVRFNGKTILCLERQQAQRIAIVEEYQYLSYSFREKEGMFETTYRGSPMRFALDEEKDNAMMDASLRAAKLRDDKNRETGEEGHSGDDGDFDLDSRDDY